ncbi:MAG: hypothetical protein ACREJB_15755, partial [Planctomycetaceae bacterium]
ATEAIYGQASAGFCRPCRGLRFVIDAFPRADALGYHLQPLPGLKTPSEDARPNARLMASIIFSLLRESLKAELQLRVGAFFHTPARYAS